jgi:hypothetical protein
VYTEYAYGPIHRNSAEDFNARFRRTVAGIFRHRHSGLQTYRNGGAGHRLAASRAGGSVRSYRLLLDQSLRNELDRPRPLVGGFRVAKIAIVRCLVEFTRVTARDPAGVVGFMVARRPILASYLASARARWSP